MIKVIIADDHPVVLDGMSRVLALEVGMQVVGSATNSTQLVALLESTACDVIVTDYSMPGGQFGDGLPMLQMLRRRYPTTRIVVMTMLDNPALIRNIQKVGISVILNKTDPVQELIPAVRAAFSGLSYQPASVRAILASGGLDEPSRRPILTRRELEVIRQCAAGVPVIEIARQANRSSKTISAQKSIAMKKLGLANDYELYEYARTNGLLGGAG
ncbi:response regulator transcription factor [Cupriavidus necator]|uniref:response regulator transcription factor n=1 Tax=Cupriavidus necator TaxID=106590 RepID=UPI0027D7A96F|nr:response regulator transcription factor [Cupriavidus necator]